MSRAGSVKRLYRWVTRVSGRMLGAGGILAYHGIGRVRFAPGMHVQEEVFRQQIAELQRRFRFIALGDLVERMEDGESIDGYLALTFDDAYVGLLRYAAPFLVDRGIPATVFVTAEASESQAP